jgi:hypothetical protein
MTKDRYPRTLNEAFGPYNDRWYSVNPHDWQDLLVGVCSLVAGVVLVGLVLWGVV